MRTVYITVKCHTWVNTTPGLTFIELCLISLTLITWWEYTHKLH